MFLRAGALSLTLLLASRLLGVARESALAAAFGSSGLGDVAVLALTLPDWVASVLASGALAYVLLPAWAGQAAGSAEPCSRAVAQRHVRSNIGLPKLHKLGLGIDQRQQRLQQQHRKGKGGQSQRQYDLRRQRAAGAG